MPTSAYAPEPFAQFDRCEGYAGQSNCARLMGAVFDDSAAEINREDYDRF